MQEYTEALPTEGGNRCRSDTRRNVVLLSRTSATFTVGLKAPVNDVWNDLEPGPNVSFPRFASFSNGRCMFVTTRGFIPLFYNFRTWTPNTSLRRSSTKPWGRAGSGGPHGRSAMFSFAKSIDLEGSVGTTNVLWIARLSDCTSQFSTWAWGLVRRADHIDNNFLLSMCQLL